MLRLSSLERVFEERPDGLEAALANDGEARAWVRAIVWDDVSLDGPVLPIAHADAQQLYLAALERLVLHLGQTSDWPGCGVDWWPDALDLDRGSLLAVWDYDYYVVILTVRPHSADQASVEFRVASHTALELAKTRG